MSPVANYETADTKTSGGFMQAQVKQNGDWTVVMVKGRIELEKTAAFREACLKSLSANRVVFEMSKLQFVGSTGMTEFFQCLADIEKVNGCRVHMVGLSEDFKKFVQISSAATLNAFSRIEEAFSFVAPEIGSAAASDLKKD